jgi:putative ABC transport system ATP-binding protein
MGPYKYILGLTAGTAIAATLLTLSDRFLSLRFPLADAFYGSPPWELLAVAVLWFTTALLLLVPTASRGRSSERAASKAALPEGVRRQQSASAFLRVGEPLLKAVRITKVYDTGKVKVDALRGIDLEVRKGEMVAITGPSGCGKTTLLNCLSGIDDVTEGEVYIRGTLLSELSDNERTDYRAARMGFIFQTYNLIPVLTAVENVEMPLLIVGTSPREARRRSLEALAAVGLREEAMRRPTELSGGQEQRVAIARAIVNHPEVVFADEPTGNLDSETSQEIVALLRELNRTRGLTVVVVTHDPSVSRYADRILTMRSGQIVEEKRLQEA